MIVAYITAYRKRFGVEPICRVLSEHGMKIAPSTYYAAVRSPVSATELADAYAANVLFDLYRANRSVYGLRKCWHAMRHAGHDLGRDQVGRLMTIVGITGVVRGRTHRTRTTESDTAAPRHPDLIGRAWATPTRQDQWWVADFTYVWTLAGFVYVAFLTDVYSRRILGWRVSTSKATPLVTSCLEQALFTRRRANSYFTATGIVHHSDAGSQGGINWSSQHLDGQVERWEQHHGRSECVPIEGRSRHRVGPRLRGGRIGSSSGRLSLAA